MPLKIDDEIMSLLRLIREELPPDQPLYIAGGAVRDLLLGRNLHDLDFVMDKNPTKLAKRIARRLKSGFFVLDDDRHTSRVVYHLDDGSFFPLDFVQFTGKNLDEDLKNRDFTINAMAVPVSELNTVIDPLGSQGDLEKGLLRPCSDRSMIDDPVRVLRGIRLAQEFDYRYTEDLEKLMIAAASFLANTSFERQRDELFRILEGPAPGQGLQDCFRFRVMDSLIPEWVTISEKRSSSVKNQSYPEFIIDLVERLTQLTGLIIGKDSQVAPYPGWVMEMKHHLGHYFDRITDYLDEEVTPGRKKKGLIYLGAILLGDLITPGPDQYSETQIPRNDSRHINKDVIMGIGRRLRLSNEEIGWLTRLVIYFDRLLKLFSMQTVPDRRSIYRFYKRAGEAGIGIVILMLARYLAVHHEEENIKKWNQVLESAGVLLSAWWDQREIIIEPQLFYDGHDLQQQFDLLPGKQIGCLLLELAEAQASGDVVSKKQAKAFIDAQVKRLDTGGQNYEG